MMKNHFIILFFLLLFYAPLHSQNVEWLQTIRPGGNEYVWDLDVDDQGNIYATGRVKFSSTFGWSPNTQSPPAIGVETDVFVVKYDSDGNLIWVRRNGGLGPEWGRCLAIDNNYNVISVGDYCDTAYWDATMLIGKGTTLNRNAFVTKYNSSGSALWSRSIGNSADHSRAYGVSLDENGNSYVVGHVSGQDVIDGKTFGINGRNIPYLVCFDPNGNCLRARHLTVNYSGEANAVVYKDGYNYLTGSFRGTMYFGTSQWVGNSPSWGDVFIAKFDTLGNFIWVQTAIGFYQDQGNDIDIDEDGNLYVIGTFANDITFGSTTLNSVGTGGSAATANAGVDVFVAKYDSNGNFIWVKQIGAPTGISGARIKVAKGKNRVVISGMVNDPTTADGQSILTNNSSPDAYCGILDYDGNFLWHKTLGGSGIEFGDALALSSQGDIYLGGHFELTSIFDTINVTAQNGYDGYVAKITPPLMPDLFISDTLICENQNAITAHFTQLGSSYTYNWFLNSNNQLVLNDTIIFNSLAAGNYNLELTLQNNFTSGNFLFPNIQVNSNPVPYLGTDTTLCNGSNLILDPGVFDSYVWQDNSTNNSFNVASQGTYWVTVTDTNFCVGSDTINVNFDPCLQVDEFVLENLLIYPNPNAGEMYLSNPSHTQLSLSIYSTYGQLIYSISSSDEILKMNIENHPNGLYLYTISDAKNNFVSGTIIKMK